MQISKRKALAAIVLPMALFVAACGSSGGDDASSSKGSDTTMKDSATTTMATDDSSTTKAMAPEGPACDSVPTSGKGSFDGMAADPVATAASNNPALSTLVTAVKQAGLVDTLNSGGPYTVFAPVDDAFAKIPAEDLKAVLADKEKLTSILTYHVLPEQVQMDELGGTYKTVNGAELTVSGDGPEFKVGDATVVCAGIQTGNATVYLIDSVLMPPAG